MQLSHWLQKVIKDPKGLEEISHSEKRIVRAYKEYLGGYKLNLDEILNETVKVKDYPGFVIERDITFYSMCPHHFLPYFGHIDIVYEPGTIITGLGKLPRLAKAVSSRLEIQEFIVKTIAEKLMKNIDAKGVYVEARAKHLCICSRGPSDTQASTTCSYMTGTFKDPAHLDKALKALKNS